MIDHIGIYVADLSRSKEFYEAALLPIGYKVSFGKELEYWAFEVGGGLFEIMQATQGQQPSPVHVAFKVDDSDEVKKFYEAALAAGAQANGAPGPRPEYTDTYFAAFILDPDRNNIEAMCEV